MNTYHIDKTYGTCTIELYGRDLRMDCEFNAGAQFVYTKHSPDIYKDFKEKLIQNITCSIELDDNLSILFHQKFNITVQTTHLDIKDEKLRDFFIDLFDVLSQIQ